MTVLDIIRWRLAHRFAAVRASVAEGVIIEAGEAGVDEAKNDTLCIRP